MQTATQVILFDVGGVLVELGPSPFPVEVEFVMDVWQESKAALAFEKGFTTAVEFAHALIAEHDIDCDIGMLIDHFRSWPRGPYPRVYELLSAVRQRYRVAILTNTNALHWSRFHDEFALHEYCERIFASHQLGMAKPEPEIFEYVIGALDAPPAHILFVDDNAANVAAAGARGMQAVQARGVEAVVESLASRGIIDTAGQFPATGV